ncbi:tRNA lysidine(34) synthetase TilS [Litorimonas sp. RW-G-Af-16]|uniref:tRNA lysidine(34) synthetase TilS n=1 Tax=Litorimonas sp. RW-G-Af-16 TaxID=3241168 RepID=UPI00390C9525
MTPAQFNQLFSFVQTLDTPVAIAFSGGGDSTALLHALRDHPLATHAFIIDHNLRRESALETERSADFARDLGYTIITKRWDHGGVTTGLQVKARAYRYAAMGDMCRRAGLAHLLTAHTADDQAETLLMRKARLTGWRGLAGMAESAYGPLWPALAEVTLHRPLLRVSRQDLRAYNRAENLSWIDDPSNENQDFTRIKARSELGVKAGLTEKLLEVQTQNRARRDAEAALFGTWLARHATLHAAGYVTTTRVPPVELLLHLLRAVSGSGGPIDAARREALAARMEAADFDAATLAGAWVVKTADGFLFTRDPVAVKGRAGGDGDGAALAAPVDIPTDYPLIWDGRFAIQASQTGFAVQAAYGHLQKLDGLTNYPKEVRGTLPMIVKGEIIYGDSADGVQMQNLVTKRLYAHFGTTSKTPKAI